MNSKTLVTSVSILAFAILCSITASAGLTSVYAQENQNQTEAEPQPETTTISGVGTAIVNININTLPGPAGEQGPAGPAGPNGTQGVQGPAGENGVVLLNFTNQDIVLECGFDESSQQVTCNQIPQQGGNATEPEVPINGNITIPPEEQNPENVTEPAPEVNTTLPVVDEEPSGNETEIEPDLNGTIPFLPPSVIDGGNGTDGGGESGNETSTPEGNETSSEVPIVNGTDGEELGSIEYNAQCYCFVLNEETGELDTNATSTSEETQLPPTTQQ